MPDLVLCEQGPYALASPSKDSLKERRLGSACVGTDKDRAESSLMHSVIKHS